MRPGPGWTNAGSPAVYDHSSGIRVHVYGLVRLVGGQIVVGSTWPESLRLSQYIKINGGNRKRGAMAWALTT